MKYLSLVWSNLKRKKLRTILTVLSIFVAFLLYGFLVAIKEGLVGGVSLAGEDRLVVRHKVSFIQTLPQSYQARIANVHGVEAVAHFTWFGGLMPGKPKEFFATMPTEPAAFLDIYPENLLPADQRELWLRTRTGCIVGRGLANRFGWKVGDRFQLTSPIWGAPANSDAWEFEICGIFDGAKKNTDTSGMYFRYDYLEETRQKEKGKVGWYVLRIKEPDRAPEIAKQIDALFENSPHETKTETEAAMIQGFAQQMGDIGSIMTAVLSAVFFTILLVAGNTMGQSIRERTEELGVLKALGYTNSLVLVLVLAESLLIALLGGLGGLGLAWIFTLQGNPVPNMLPNFYLPDRALVIGVILAFALGLVAGVFPAWQAMRLQIAVALRRNA